MLCFFVGGFNPVEKHACQNGFIIAKDPGENIKYLSCHPPSYGCFAVFVSIFFPYLILGQ